MSFEWQHSFDLDNGISITDVQGSTIFIGGGSDSPIGNDAPVGSFYFRTDGTIWKKFNVGDNDWRLFPNAGEIPFDNSSNGFEADNTQDAIAEVGAGASPGFSFSRSGSILGSSWLNRSGGVGSNRAGISVFIDDPVVTLIACTTENLNTYEVTVYEHDGDEINLTAIGTVAVNNERTKLFEVNWPTHKGKQLAVKISDGSANNLGVDLQLKGNS